MNFYQVSLRLEKLNKSEANMKSLHLLIVLIISNFSFGYEFGIWKTIPSEFFKLNSLIETEKNTAAELALLHKLKLRERTELICEIANSQRFPEFHNLFQNELMNNYYSFNFPPENLESIKLLIKKLLKFSERVSSFYKKNYDRKRPFSIDASLNPCVDVETESRSYPSFHSVAGALSTCVLSYLYPSASNLFEEYGIFVGKIRSVVGVHFPSDVAAGYELGINICETLLKDSSFQNDLSTLGIHPNS